MTNWTIEYYRSANGRIPVQDFIRSLGDHEAARVIDAIEVLAEYGTAARMPLARKMSGSDLWELRIRGKSQHRVFYVAMYGNRLLLLHAFTKKSQQTPRREIRTAERRLREYRR